MGNVVDYVGTMFDTFAMRPFSSVDSLALSQLVYARMPQEIPSGNEYVHPVNILHAEALQEIFVGNSNHENMLALTRNLVESPRFRDIRVGEYSYSNDFSHQHEKQFAAATFILPDGTAYIAFRGTEVSAVGWKEDFAMTYSDPIPSQLEAVKYLERVAADIPDMPLRLGGHSKGGNMAVYAGMNCSDTTRKRIVKIYSHDGPGFSQKILKASHFEEIEQRIEKTVPEASVIGMLLESPEKYRVVKCEGTGVLQHLSFNWVVEDGDFVTLPGLSKSAQYLNASIDTWMSSISTERRIRVIDTVFNVIQSGGYDNLSELTHHAPEALSSMRKKIDEVPAEDQELVTEILKALIGVLMSPATAGIQSIVDYLTSRIGALRNAVSSAAFENIENIDSTENNDGVNNHEQQQ